MIFKEDVYNIYLPLIFSALHVIFGFLFFGFLGRQGDYHLGLFSFYHSFIIIFSHFFRLGADFEILSSNELITTNFKSIKSLFKAIFSLNCIILILSLFSKFFIYENIFLDTFLGSSLFALNIFISFFLRKKGHSVFYSFFVNSPFILALSIIQSFDLVDPYTAINVFILSLMILNIFAIILVAFHLNFRSYLKVELKNIKFIFSNLRYTFSANLLLLFLSQFPVLVFGFVNDFSSSATFKIINKISSIIILISQQVFTRTIPKISAYYSKDNRRLFKEYKISLKKSYTFSLLYFFIILLFSDFILNFFSLDITISILIMGFVMHMPRLLTGPIPNLLVVLDMKKDFLRVMFACLIISVFFIIPLIYFKINAAILFMFSFSCFMSIYSLVLIKNNKKLNV